MSRQPTLGTVMTVLSLPALRPALRLDRRHLFEALLIAIAMLLMVAALAGWRTTAVVPSTNGAVVDSVTVGTGAWDSGVRPGDRIRTLDASESGAVFMEIERADGGVTGLFGAGGELRSVEAYLPLSLLAALALVGAIARERWWSGTLAIAAVVALGMASMDLGALIATPLLIAAVYYALRPADRFSVIGLATASGAGVAWLGLALIGAAPWIAVVVAAHGFVFAAVAVRGLRGVRRIWRALPPMLIGARALALLDELIPGRASARLRSAEHERVVLADRLHASLLPELGQIIAGLEQDAGSSERAERLRAVSSELRELMNERRLMLLDALGLVPALEWLTEHVRDGRVSIELACAVDADAPRPPREIEQAAFRVAQQALDNAMTHGRADRVEVLLERSDPNGCSLSIIDNGVGFSPDRRRAAVRSGHHGLLEMERRSALVGATCTIASGPSGTEVEFQWSA